MRNRSYQVYSTRRRQEMESAGQILGRVLLDAQAHVTRNRRPARARKRPPLQGVQLDLFPVNPGIPAKADNPADQPLLDLFPEAYK